MLCFIKKDGGMCYCRLTENKTLLSTEEEEEEKNDPHGYQNNERQFRVYRLPWVCSHAVEYCHYTKVHFLHHHSVFLDLLKHYVISNKCKKLVKMNIKQKK